MEFMALMICVQNYYKKYNKLDDYGPACNDISSHPEEMDSGSTNVPAVTKPPEPLKKRIK